jgi:hypothetical protein
MIEGFSFTAENGGLVVLFSAKPLFTPILPGESLSSLSIFFIINALCKTDAVKVYEKLH